MWRSVLHDSISVSSAVAEIYALYDSMRVGQDFVWRAYLGLGSGLADDSTPSLALVESIERYMAVFYKNKILV